LHYQRQCLSLVAQMGPYRLYNLHP
jgi:hypothetical protein